MAELSTHLTVVLNDEETHERLTFRIWHEAIEIQTASGTVFGLGRAQAELLIASMKLNGTTFQE